MKTRLIVVPHSHWDREWYASYETMRFHLVQFMDRLIEVLERDTSIPGFLLDGQMILVDDYLEIHPEMESRFRALAARGRFTLGPWYVQPDEFVVCGEALVRNLQMGIAQARAFGSPMLEGYVPDTFGHVDQLPQILGGFGIESFYTMRGLGEDVDSITTEFYWQAPDGSTVLAHFLAESYSNAGTLGMTPETSSVHHGKTVFYDNLFELVERMDSRSSAHVILLMNGSDHTALQEDVGEAVRSLSADLDIRLGLLEDFHKAVEGAGGVSATVRGELRYGRYQPVFKGVFSSRIYIKQLNDVAEECLLGEAERFSSMAASVGLPLRQASLSHAWELLLQNHAHDSICGCSVDAVHEEVVTRFHRSIEVAEAVADEALEAMSVLVVASASAPPDKAIPIVVFNPSPWQRSGRTTVAIHPIADSPLGARRFGFSEPRRDFSLDSCVLENADGLPVGFKVESTDVTVEDVLLRRKVLYTDTISFVAEDVPALGYRLFYLRRGLGRGSEVDAPRGPSHEEAEGKAEISSSFQQAPGRVASPPDPAPEGLPVLANGRVRVTLHEDGCLSVFDRTTEQSYDGFNVFVDEGDAGDEYTFSPPLVQSRLGSEKLDWHVAQSANRLVARADFPIPRSLSEDRSSRSAATSSCKIETVVEIEPDSPLVRIRTSIENLSSDHRLRVHFPTGIEAHESVAETAFGLIHRPTALEPSLGGREQPSGCYPQQRFVAIEHDGVGFALFNKGLPEYEATPEGVVALTLLRSVGWLSRSDLESRPGQVGPELPTPGAQCLGRQEFEYSFCLFSGPLQNQPLFRLAEEYIHPLKSRSVQTVLRVPGRIDFESFLSIDNPHIVLSALRSNGDTLILRVFNPSGESQSFTSRWAMALDRVERTQLDEGQGSATPISDDHTFTASVSPYAIATFRIRFKS